MKKILVLLVIIFLTGCSDEKVELVANKANLNDLVIEDKQFQDFVTSNTSLIYDQGISTFKSIIKNNGQNKEIKNIKVKFLNKNNSEIITLTKKVDKILGINNEYNIVIISDIDLTDAYNIEYIID